MYEPLRPSGGAHGTGTSSHSDHGAHGASVGESNGRINWAPAATAPSPSPSPTASLTAPSASAPLLSPLESASASDRCGPSPSDSSHNGDEQYVQYRIRWLVLAAHAALSISNAVLWIGFAPIQEISAAYFGVSNSWINMLSVSFMALYLPGYLLSLVVFSRRGLRYGLCLAALLQTAGAWTRVMGTIGASDDHAVHTRGFLIVFIGQCMAAMAQPMFMNAPARLASEWFGTSQRELATTIGAMSNPVGIAIGQLLPTALVSASGRGMSTLLLVTAGASTATMLFCFLCVRSEPVTAPSRSMEERRAARADAASASALSRAAVPFGQSPLVLELKSLASNRQFWVLMFGVGMGLGLFNAVTTLIGQLVRPAGYTKDDAGNFGALLIGCGLVGAAVVGPIMDKTKAFNALLKAGLIAAMSGTCFMLLSLRPGHSAQVCASFGVLGFVMLPLLPVCMACAAECTYPVSEDASSGAMLFAGNIVGIVMISVVGEIIQTKYSTVWNPASITLMCMLGTAVVVVALLYKGPMLRQAAERARLNNKNGDSTAGLEAQLLI